MIMKTRKLKLKINKPVCGYEKGDIITLECNMDKIPLSAYWRRRLIDAKIDGCCEFISTVKQRKLSKSSKSSKLSEGKLSE